MEHITSRKALPESGDEIGKSLWFNMWKVRLRAYETLTVGDILYWYDSQTEALVWKTRVEDVDRFEYQNKTAAGDRMERRFGSFDRSEWYFREKAPSRGYCLAFKVSPIQKLHVPKPQRNVSFPRQGWLYGGPRIQYWLRGARKGDKRVGADSLAVAALPLALHGRYSRAEIFPTMGINYTPQKPQLNTGLSPQCRDGGFFIFVTLNKEGYPPGQDYGDELYRDKLSWVSRRGVNETQKDYVKLRDANTRVSLFVRNNQAEKFVYAGELKYQSHRQVQEGIQTVQSRKAYMGGQWERASGEAKKLQRLGRKKNTRETGSGLRLLVRSSLPVCWALKRERNQAEASFQEEMVPQDHQGGRFSDP